MSTLRQLLVDLLIGPACPHGTRPATHCAICALRVRLTTDRPRPVIRGDEKGLT